MSKQSEIQSAYEPSIEYCEQLAGKTLTGASTKLYPNGDKYLVLHFGDQWVEWMMHFSGVEHQLAIAQKALQAIVARDPAKMLASEASYLLPIRKTALDALKAMKEFEDEATKQPDAKSAPSGTHKSKSGKDSV